MLFRSVEECLASVLAQREVDFEVLIADDGSQDDTALRVAKCHDPRVRFWPHVVNRGACVVVNELLQHAKGTYIALINSDDVWPRSDKLALQCALLDAQPEWGAIFGRAELMDRNGAAITASDNPFSGLFNQANRSQAQWLRFFFERGNCLCHPTMMIRRRCYEDLGGYNNRFRQLPDFEMWVRLIKRYAIHIADDVWVRFRVRPGENASSPTLANCVRDINEHLLLREQFFAGTSAEILQAAFTDWLPKGIDWTDDAHLAVARVWPFLRVTDGPYRRVCRVLAFMKLRQLLDDERCRQILESNYGFDDRAFQRIMTEEDCLFPHPKQDKPPGLSIALQNATRWIRRRWVA